MSECGAFFVYGCYGTLSVEVGTGRVVRYDPDDPNEPEYADLARIDINAYESATGLTINRGDRVCIMDLGFWSHDGQRFVPDHLSKLPKNDGKGDWPEHDVVVRRIKI